MAHLDHSVISVRDRELRTADGALPALAYKDFSELVVVRGQPRRHPHIVRFVEKVVAMREMPRGRVRIRTKRSGDRGEE